MATDISALRENYTLQTLETLDVAPHPTDQFAAWFEAATNSQLREPNAMTLATATTDGRPSARIVLLKGFDEQGFVFFTNYESRKGQEMTANPHAALLFNWLELERQIRIEGTVKKISEAASRQYFQSRPKGSQIGAWASPQSQVIADRDVLELRQAELTARYADEATLPLPAFWGGFILKPTLFEFWQGRPSRLHDRIQYQEDQQAGSWRIVRLAP